MRSHALSFVAGAVLASVVVVLLTRGPSVAPGPERPPGDGLSAARAPRLAEAVLDSGDESQPESLVAGAAPAAPNAPRQEPPLTDAPVPAPPVTGETRIATDSQILLAIEGVCARHPIDDEALLRRVRNSTIIGVKGYRTQLSLTAHQAGRLAELYWKKSARLYPVSGQIQTALARVRRDFGHQIREEDLDAVDNDFDVYRRYDAELDRLLDLGPNLYREFCFDVRSFLTKEQQDYLDEHGKLIVR